MNQRIQTTELQTEPELSLWFQLWTSIEAEDSYVYPDVPKHKQLWLSLDVGCITLPKKRTNFLKQ